MIRTLLRLGDAASRRSLLVQLVLMAIAAAIVAALLTLLVPLIEALLSPEPARAIPVAIWMTVLAIALVALEWTISTIDTNGSMRQILRLHALLEERVVRLPLGYFTSDRAGLIASLASRGVPMAASAPGSLVRTMSRSLLAPALCVFALCFVDPFVGGAASLGVLVVLLVYRRVHRVNYEIEREVDRTNTEGAARVLEFAEHQAAVRAAGANSLAEQAVRTSIDEQAAAKRVSEDRRGWGNTMMNLTVYAFLALSVVASTVRLSAGALSFETYAALLTVLTVLTGMVLRVLPFGRGIELAKNVLTDLDSVLSHPVLPEPVGDAEGRDGRTPTGFGIEFDEVDFSYGAAEPVLRGVSPRFPEGRTTAIVGPSGSGKSTMLRLIARFWDVDGGSVRIGGVDVRRLAEREVLDRLSMVFQDVYLFEASLLENIRLGRPGASDDEVRRAAEFAGVAEIASRLPLGLDTPVGPGGTTLSGGERQRVSIARAMLKDAPILLLDEATSALDIENELLIRRSLSAMRGEKTVVMVAHRLSFIRDADHIVVLDGHGGVEAQGTHEELLECSPIYAGFCRERSEATNWKLR